MKTVDMTAKECKEREVNGLVYQSVTTGSLDTDSMDGVVSHLNMKKPIKRRHSANNFARQLSLRKKQRLQRLVNKNGSCNVAYSHVPKRGLYFFADIFTTLIDLKWRYLLVIFSLAYVSGWVAFAGIWYGLIWSHGDVGYIEKAASNDSMYADWEPCVYNVENFIGAFQFSVETQTTIGYGYRGTTEACWLAAVLVVIQSVFSCLVDAVFIGMVFAKIARPKKRAATIKFSHSAVIAERDGALCFMFRIGDIRRSHIYESHIRGQLIGPRVTEEGECIPLHTYNMDFGNGTGDDRIFLVWPIIICHVIDEKSPLYNISAADLIENNFEIIVCMEGVLEQTGLVTQARTSYLPSEIIWGHRFSSTLISVDKEEQFKVDYREFNNVYAIPNMPSCSAAELDDMRGRNVEEPEEVLEMKPILKSSRKRTGFQCNIVKPVNGNGNSALPSNGNSALPSNGNSASKGNGNGNGALKGNRNGNSALNGNRNGAFNGKGNIRFADDNEMEEQHKISRGTQASLKSEEAPKAVEESLSKGHSLKKSPAESRESPV